jgi:hypothetical protein
MERCNDRCTKDVTGTCALCEARTGADRFVRPWFKGGLFLDCRNWLTARLQDQSKAPVNWLYPVPRVEVRHKDVVREAHKQYSETLNKTMLTLLGVALFCMVITIGAPDKSLLVADHTIKVPFTDASVPFLGFLVVASLLLLFPVLYLHILYHYWLECERERQYINQRLIPPIESIPTLFVFPDGVSRFLTALIFYGLVPSVLLMITRKASALPEMGLPLMYVTRGISFVLLVLLMRRHLDHPLPLRLSHSLMDCGFLAVIIGLVVFATVKPQRFQRPFLLVRTDLAQAWLPRTNMRNAFAVLANFQDANLSGANLQGADLRGANLQGVDLQGADLRGEPFYKTKLMGAKNLTQEQVNTACINEHTQLPEGLIRPAPCPAKP